jgi:sensor histidine kinase YesM
MSKQFQVIVAFFLLSVFSITKTEAQNEIDRNGLELPFSIYITDNDSLSPEEILDSNKIFKLRDSLTLRTKPSEVYWLRIDFENELGRIQSDSIWYLRFNSFEYSSVFYRNKDKIIEERLGLFENRKTKKSILHTSGFPFNTESLIDGRFLFLKLKRVTYQDKPSRWKVSYCSRLQNDLFLEFYSVKDLNKIIAVYTFAGICLVIFILTLAYYLYSRRLEFLFYTSYVLFLFFYLTADVFKLHELFFGHFGLYSYTFFQVSQVVINLFYILFVIYYLDSKTVYPKLHIALKTIAWVLSVIVALDIYFLLSHTFIGSIYLLDLERIIMTVFGLVGMTYLLIKSKDKLGYFIVAGSFFYMIGALGLLFTQIRLLMITGSSLEILIFASGLTYKIQQEHFEKLRIQKEASVLENRALRAQMNPHFIFNSLSSIQHLITSDKKESAVKYLNKFSLLMRNLLESSFDANVILAEEISLLKKYLELEALRFDNSFEYSITVDQNLDQDAVEVPALLIQPFVENAILHGLLNKTEGEKKLQIHFKKEDSFIICEIKDNGIGRKASEKYKSVLKSSKKSRGIEVTKKRLQLLNPSEENRLQFIDKTDELGNPEGTLVIIKISIE